MCMQWLLRTTVNFSIKRRENRAKDSGSYQLKKTIVSYWGDNEASNYKRKRSK